MFHMFWFLHIVYLSFLHFLVLCHYCSATAWMRCVKAEWGMWFSWILVLAQTYCCLKRIEEKKPSWKSQQVDVSTCTQSSPCSDLKCFISWRLIWYLRAKTLFFQSVLTSFVTLNLFLLCCTCRVKWHQTIWVSAWLHMAKLHWILIRTSQRDALWSQGKDRNCIFFIFCLFFFGGGKM